MDIAKINGLYELGKSLALMGKTTEADTKFKQAIDSIGHEATGMEDILYKLYKAHLDMNLADETERNNIQSAMMEIFGTQDAYIEKVLYDLAQVHKMTGDKPRYISALEQIVERFEKPQPDVYFELALMHQNDSKPKQAIGHFLTYLGIIGKKHPNTMISATNLASCYNATGQPERAHQTLKRYLNLK